MSCRAKKETFHILTVYDYNLLVYELRVYGKYFKCIYNMNSEQTVNFKGSHTENTSTFIHRPVSQKTFSLY